MFRNLSPYAIGIRKTLEENVRLAKLGDFQGVDVNIVEVSRIVGEKSLEYLRRIFLEEGIRPGGWWLPFDWRGGVNVYERGLNDLRRLAPLAAEIDCRRALTFILPFSDDKPFDENFRWHVSRLKPIAEILRESGCMLGLEFVGTESLRAGRKYTFIYNLDGILSLCRALESENVGVLLDSWHWYASGGTLEDLMKLKGKDIVYVHVNDAPPNVPLSKLIDNVRCLPGETGIIDLVGFLRVLKNLGYDGPVTPEPFSEKVNRMKPEDAVRVTGEALKSVWRRAGLGN
ncbi:MAG: sugar phosphate isomerase/epimerase family protein [Candidatus Bathyarchaeia archaeon]